jgi:uncharacterized protein (TIGR03435 family)
LKHSLLLVTVGTLVAIPIFSQTPADTKPSFEIASVKQSAALNAYAGGSPGRFIATGVSLRLLIMNAYRVRDFQLTGGPGWVNTDRWDIEAKAKADDAALPPATGSDPTKPNRGDLMLQSLLEDRFQLKVHREMKDLPVYELKVAKNGLQIKDSAGVPAGRPRMRSGRGNFEAYELSLAGFANLLSMQVERIVIDRTNVTGLYDISLKWTEDRPRPNAAVGADGAEPAAPSDQLSIFTALQEQLGLKLESARGPVEVLVIDSVGKPAEN